jgi:hypothetical protein
MVEMGHASEMIVAAGAGNASVSKWNSFQVDGSAVGWLAYGERMLCDYSLFGLCFHQMSVCTLYTWYGCGFLTVHRPWRSEHGSAYCLPSDDSDRYD